MPDNEHVKAAAEDTGPTIDSLGPAFKKLRFRKKLLFGYDDADVWAKLEKLQKLYRDIYERRELELLALIADREKTIERLRKSPPGGEDERGDPDGS